MGHPFIRKLRRGAHLNAEDEAILQNLAQPVRSVRPHAEIWNEDSAPRFLPLILEGWACRYKLLDNGKRQIVSLFLPGDLCGPFGVLPRFLGHSLGALTAVAFVAIEPSAIAHAAQMSPRIKEALWWDLLAGSAIEREFIVSLGRRSAAERMGHLFCELHVRLDAVGLVKDFSYDLPLTQADLGDALGLSTVHVNRSLQDLRKAR